MRIPEFVVVRFVKEQPEWPKRRVRQSSERCENNDQSLLLLSKVMDSIWESERPTLTIYCRRKGIHSEPSVTLRRSSQSLTSSLGRIRSALID